MLPEGMLPCQNFMVQVSKIIMPMNILLTSAGRRVELIEIFKKALGKKGKVYSADCDRTAPTLYFADKGFIIPKVDSKNYINILLELCKKEKIKLLVPLIDPELPKIAKARKEFISNDIIPLISEYKVVSIANDKYLTAQFFNRHGIPSPKTLLADSLKDETKLTFPLILKPRFGYASICVQKCGDIESLIFFKKKIRPAIIQEFLSGDEVTVDVLCNFKGELISLVQRMRIKVRAGEVERAVTVKDNEITKLVKKIIEILKPYGVINLQCFNTARGIYFTEINPRFGGGYPLSYQAGADFPKIILDLIEGKKIHISRVDDYKVGCYMLRYDNAAYLSEGDLKKA